MKAIKVTVTWEEDYKMMQLMHLLNVQDDIAVVCVGPPEYVVATVGSIAMDYVRDKLQSNIMQYKIQELK